MLIGNTNPTSTPALSRSPSHDNIHREVQPFTAINPPFVPPTPSTSKQTGKQKRLGSSHGKAQTPDPQPTDIGFDLDTDLTNMEGILADNKDSQPKRSKRQGSASTAGKSSSSSVKESSNSSSKTSSNNPRKSFPKSSYPPVLLPPPTFLTDGQFDLDPLPRSKRPRANTSKSSYNTSPRNIEPPTLTGALSMPPPSPNTEKPIKSRFLDERGDTKFPANSKWRINPPDNEIQMPRRGKRSGPPSPKQPDDHIQLGGIRTKSSSANTPQIKPQVQNPSTAWQAPESWGIVQAPSHENNYESESTEEEGDEYYDDDDNYNRRVSNYFDYNSEENNWNGAFGEAANWGASSIQRSSADQNAGITPFKLKPSLNQSSSDVNELKSDSRKNSDSMDPDRSRQNSNASGQQLYHLVPEQNDNNNNEMGEDIRKASIRRASSRHGSPAFPRPSTAGSASQQGSRGSTGNYCIRVYKSDGTYLTFSCGLHTSVNELSHMVAKKLRVQPAMYQLYMREKMKERAMGSSEKPLMLQKRRLEQLGFTDNDHLDELGKEDLSFICRFIYRIATVTYYEAVSEKVYKNNYIINNK